MAGFDSCSNFFKARLFFFKAKFNSALIKNGRQPDFGYGQPDLAQAGAIDDGGQVWPAVARMWPPMMM